MARPRSKYPTDLELEILKILWKLGPLPVRQVREALEPARILAYTSVMTIMNIMVRKGYLRRVRSGVSFTYYPKLHEQVIQQSFLSGLVQKVFDGSASAVVANLLQGEINPDELLRLRKLLDEKLAKEN